LKISKAFAKSINQTHFESIRMSELTYSGLIHDESLIDEIILKTRSQIPIIEAILPDNQIEIMDIFSQTFFMMRAITSDKEFNRDMIINDNEIKITNLSSQIQQLLRKTWNVSSFNLLSNIDYITQHIEAVLKELTRLTLITLLDPLKRTLLEALFEKVQSNVETKNFLFTSFSEAESNIHFICKLYQVNRASIQQLQNFSLKLTSGLLPNDKEHQTEEFYKILKQSNLNDDLFQALVNEFILLKTDVLKANEDWTAINEHFIMFQRHTTGCSLQHRETKVEINDVTNETIITICQNQFKSNRRSRTVQNPSGTEIEFYPNIGIGITTMYDQTDDDFITLDFKGLNITNVKDSEIPNVKIKVISATGCSLNIRAVDSSKDITKSLLSEQNRKLLVTKYPELFNGSIKTLLQIERTFLFLFTTYERNRIMQLNGKITSNLSMIQDDLKV